MNEISTVLMQDHLLECDILVAGGGPAGVPCALAAARNGAKVILVQDRSVLGGNASSEVRMHIVGADCSGGRGIELETEAREGGIIEEIRLELGMHNPQRSASMLDLILYDKCRAEPNLTLLLDTTVIAVKVEEDRIQYCLAERQSTQDRFQIKARIFVDCTGDGRLGSEAAAPFRHGREAREEFGESYGHVEADSKTLGSTLLFTASKYDRPMPFVAPAWVRHFTEDDLKLREHASPGVDSGLEYGYWWVEWGGQIDTIKDNALIRDELLAIMLGVWNHIKNDGDHGAENWALNWFGFLPGKRESRRFIGRHILTESDILESRPFTSAIAYGGWPLDLHPVHGVDAIDEPPAQAGHAPYLYDIPLDCCISKTVSNLMFAGRNLSATHVAFGSTRVMATCAVVGQGVGTAAAFAVEKEMDISQLASNEVAINDIQQQLLQDDCYLIGVPNRDENDLARHAQISASSEQEAGPAKNIISGQTRAVHGPRGVASDRTEISTHRWMSDPHAQLPQWLELRWETPQTISEIQLIFDTGQHRVLTLSHDNTFTSRMQWGCAQPETVRDYRLLAQVENNWIELLSVTGNYQRRAAHCIPPSAATALRIEVLATNGIDHARIMEVRVY
nr:hypothetical protein [uncultured bacterium]